MYTRVEWIRTIKVVNEMLVLSQYKQRFNDVFHCIRFAYRNGLIISR